MEPNLFIIDSSVFIAFYHRDDTQHADAVRVMGELSGKTMIVHPYVIQETATVLMYRFGIILAKRFISYIRNSSNIILPLVEIKRDIDHFTLNTKKMSFTDVALVSLAKSMGAQLLTFDRQMLSALKAKRRK